MSTETSESSRAACKVAGCGLPAVARGWCRPHYRRWQRSGDPAGLPVPPAGRATAGGGRADPCETAAELAAAAAWWPWPGEVLAVAAELAGERAVIKVRAGLEAL